MSDPVGFNETATTPHWRIVARCVAAVALAVAIGVILYARYLGEQLDAWTANHRAIEGRLSSGEYAPLDIVRSGGGSTAEALTSLANLEARLEADHSVANLHGLASEELKLGRAREASELLLEASRLDPNDAAIQTDLAAAELALGRPNDAAERCGGLLERDPTFKPAAFNWALALETLAIRSEAIEAWQKYLVLDENGGWADEARARLSVLRVPRPSWKKDSAVLKARPSALEVTAIVARNPQRVRAWVQGTLLPRWTSKSDPADYELLHEIAAARTASGDSFLRDLVLEAEHPGPDLTEGYRLFAEGQAARRAVDFELTSSKYVDAAASFARAGSPMELIAAVYASSADEACGRTAAALDRLADVDGRVAAAPERFRIVVAESQWVRGLLLFRKGEWNDSLAAFRRALDAAQQARETEHEIGIRTRIAADLDHVADPEEAERYRLDLLRQLDDSHADANTLYTTYAETSWVALSASRPHLALALINAQSKIANADPLLVTECAIKRAVALRDVGRLPAARADLAAAGLSAAAIKTAALRDRVNSERDYVTATIDAPSNPKRALASLSVALEVWDHYGWRLRSATGRLLRGSLYATLGDRKAAEADFRAGIDQMEGERKGLDEPPLQVAYFERAGDLFTRLIELLLDEGRTSDALTVAERQRARGLLDHLQAQRSGAIGAPMTAAQIGTASGSSETILETALLDRGAALWLVRGGQIWFAQSSAPKAAIEQSIDRYLAAIHAKDGAAVAREGRWLYGQLVAPIASHFDTSGPLMVIPEGALQAVSFAALVKPDGRYLIEDRAISTAPSATVYLASREPYPAPSSLFAAAEPAPPGLAALPYVADEVRRIGGLYVRGSVAIGSELTPGQFLEGMRKVTAVHFGGHAQLDAVRPDHSALIFESKGGDEPARLTAADIASSRLPLRPLVVLAACSTGRGKVRRNEGVDSLARAFLHAGARGVVGTLWDIDDRPAATLFRALHRNLRSGAGAAEALRSAQLSMLHGDDLSLRAPRSWGGAMVIGTF